jgi:hypothetical protein
MRTALLCIGVALASVVGTVVVFVVFVTLLDAQADRKIRVPFSELLQKVEEARVEEISVQGQIYTFKADGSRGTTETVGPAVGMAELLTLRPSNPTLPAPRVVAR